MLTLTRGIFCANGLTVDALRRKTLYEIDEYCLGVLNNLDDWNGARMVVSVLVTIQRTYLVRFFCAKFDVGSMNIAITYSPHSHGRLGEWLVRFVCMDLVSREVREGE